MRIKIITIISVIALLCTSCERTLDFVAGEDGMGNISIGAIVVSGSPVIVYVNNALAVDKAQLAEYIGMGEDRIKYMQAGEAIDYMSDSYFKQSAVKEAQVSADINGQTLPLSFDPLINGYTTSYVPKEGDHIVVKVIADGQELRAETVLPTTPKIEIVKYEVLAGNPYSELDGFSYQTDTIMRITCRIVKQPERQYYRLRIRSERDAHNWWHISDSIHYDGYQMQDVFFSDDELFVDKRLTSSFGGWRPFFSNVFDDSLIGTGGYTFTVDSPKTPEKTYGIVTSTFNQEHGPLPPQVMVELQSISPELYHYLKSVELYKLSYTNANTKPVQLYGNVEGGWGILGSLSSFRVFIPYD